jgi:hypothetical protein
MVRRMSWIVACLVTVIAVGCAPAERGESRHQGRPAESHPAVALPDGIYLVAPAEGVQSGPASGPVENEPRNPVPATRVIPYDHRFLDPAADEPDSIVVVPSEYVLMQLDREPEGTEGEGGKLTLLLSMTRVATDQLAQFTEKHLGERVAIVIGGQAVTQHKIRSRIEGGKLQITRCDDDACRSLLIELKDNVKAD